MNRWLGCVLNLFTTVLVCALSIVAIESSAQETSTISYAVSPICFVGKDLRSIRLPSARKGATASRNFTFVCNAANGADVTMRTRNGGLVHARRSRVVLGYSAVLSSSYLTPINTDPLELVAVGGPSPNAGDNRTATLDPLQTELAKPTSQNATITVTLNDNAPFGGRYRDRLEININAN